MHSDLDFSPGRLVILSGPSGVGKDTVLNQWHGVNPKVIRVVAATTRPPRPGEVDGVDYHFMTHEDFTLKAGSGGFLEFKQYGSSWYGTPLDQALELARRGMAAILKIEVQGAAEVRAKVPHVLSIFLMPPSFDELEARIRRRGTETEDQIQKRLERARHEIEEGKGYSHVVVNDNLDRCVRELETILNG